MAGRHLRDLISAYGERDDLKFRRAAQAIISEEESKRHNVLARDLRGLLAANGAVSVTDGPGLPEPPVDRDSALPLARISRPEKHLSDLVLSPATHDVLRQLTDEVRHWPTLDAAGLPRRNRILLSGPPGCGKSSAVAAMANELGRPLVAVRIEGLISSYLGETAANLSNLFSFAGSAPFVLFLDEFDSLGKSRDDNGDHGELRRVVNAVLQQIDAYAGPSLIVAATNHSQILDSALWRRFDAVIELGLPTVEQLGSLIKKLLPKNAAHWETVAADLRGLPHAAAEYFAMSARRHAVLGNSREIRAKDVNAALLETTTRRWL